MPGLLKDPPGGSGGRSPSPPSRSSLPSHQAIVDDLTECVDVQEWLLERYRYLRRELEDVDREVNHLRTQMEQRIQQRERNGYNNLRLSDFSEDSEGSSSGTEIDFGLGMNLRDLLRQRNDNLGLAASDGHYNPGPGILGPAPGMLVTAAAPMPTVQGVLATAGAVTGALVTAPATALATASSALVVPAVVAQNVGGIALVPEAIAGLSVGSFAAIPVQVSGVAQASMVTTSIHVTSTSSSTSRTITTTSAIPEAINDDLNEGLPK